MDLPQVANEGDLITLADMSTLNVLAQLEIKDPELAAEIKQVMQAEIRRVEIELSIMITDLKKSYDDDIAALKVQGKSLPADHDLTPIELTEADCGF
jgi:hypothetical protein